MNDIDKTDTADTPTPGLAHMVGLGVAWLAGMGALAFATLPAPTATHTSIAANTATPLGSDTLLPAGASTISEETPIRNISLKAPEQSVDFIVRFVDDIEALDACAEIYHQDKKAAQTLFADWAKQHSALNGVALTKVSYSGEMLLTWNTGINRPLAKQEVQDKLMKIKSLSAVKYADPDYTAQAQGGR